MADAAMDAVETDAVATVDGVAQTGNACNKAETAMAVAAMDAVAADAVATMDGIAWAADA